MLRLLLASLGISTIPSQWGRSPTFVLARISALGELVDLTEIDVRFDLFWLGLEYALHR